jgi:hypothetical protein
VAILGSVLASSYSSAMAPVVAPLPPEAAAVAGDSIGGALGVAARIGEAAAPLVAAARAAFVDGMTSAIWVSVAVVLLGALVTWVFLPARPVGAEITGTVEVPAGGAA